MPRFDPKRWRPSKDSSPRHFQTAVKDKRVHLDVAVRYGNEGGVEYGCPCGCGGWPKGQKARFAMGHDARYRGILIRAHLTGTQVVRHLIPVNIPQASEAMVAESALDLAKIEGESFTKAIEEAELRRDGKNREVLAKAMAVGSDRLIKVGRWEYTGQVCAIYDTGNGAEYEIEYVTKLGEVRRRRVPADQTQAA